MKIFDIFENPWTLLITAAAILLAVWISRCIATQKTRWWLWLLPGIIAGAGFGIDRLVETDTEKIEKVITGITKAFEQENCDLIASFISDNYSDSYHKTKKQLVNHCKAMLSNAMVDRAIPSIISLEKNSPNAPVIFTVRVVFNRESHISQLYKQEVFVKVQAELKKQPDNRWLIQSIEILEIDRFAATWNFSTY